MNCQERKNQAALLSVLSKHAPLKAASLLGYKRCHRVLTHFGQALLHRCDIINDTVKAMRALCGMEPIFQDFSITADGYTLVHPFVPCPHDGKFAFLNEAIYQYDPPTDDWRKSMSTITVFAHLKTHFKVEVDKSAVEGSANHPGQDAKPYMDLLGELSAMAQFLGSGSIMGALQDQRQISNMPTVDVTTFVSRWKTVFNSLIILILLA